MATKTTDWNSSVQGYKDYLVLERGLSKNSVLAYMRDIHQFRDLPPPRRTSSARQRLSCPMWSVSWDTCTTKELAETARARMLSGCAAFANTSALKG